MNKKIKIIDLFNKKANNEKMPKKFKYKNYIFELDDVNEYTIDKEKQVAFTELIQFNLNNLNDEIEILEDNTEEQENLGESWKEVGKRVGEWAKEFEKGFKESFTEIINYPFKNLEDNTEEIEELDLSELKGIYTRGQIEVRIYTKINELVSAIKQLTIKLANTEK